MEKEKHYETPRVEVIEIKVEKCFATSGFGTAGWDEELA